MMNDLIQKTGDYPPTKDLDEMEKRYMRWALAEEYFILMKKLHKKGVFSCDINVFTGWKGNFVREWYMSYIRTVWLKEKCHFCRLENCIIPVLQKLYKDRYQEHSTLDELYKVVITGSYSYQHKKMTIPDVVFSNSELRKKEQKKYQKE